MCVMLGLADSAVLMDASVSVGAVVGEQDGVVMNEGACSVVGLPKNEAQGLPSADEIAAELYVPPVEPGDAELPPVPECVDQDPEAVPHEPVSLASISATLFESSCSYSSCHGPGGAGGINLRADDLYAELFGHEVRANTSMPLVTPGDPDKSWLYTLLSQCEPTDDDGNAVTHMPYNAPTLARPELVAKVRAWIEAGAPE
ncbi:MAG: hypothetical protein IAG13_33225, partial [Deltaproteobacteria bacterium]|nr:hypothetical protein [Nannocystaceae bacterium]